MRGIMLIVIGMLLAFSASAGRITISGPEQSTTTSGRTLCVYSNSIYTFTYITKSKHCPYTKTFDTNDSN
ncbi:hypothetical protein [Citrobacter sp. Igbk 14]|uniref:hypothetical protein n=1 Tax=Citrobacter sp. Igbk 14 TaxID=2963960 RepID=UPI0023046E38|nr:hypothetical protein [Citrobacter sp. Igbk 14]MDA8514284.1 hypothetical protein [Citrobacter sp. Igbk 14]